MDGLAFQWENKTYTCIDRVKDVDSGGYLYGDDPLKHTFPVFIALVALAQIVSHVFYFLLRPLKQPKFVCNLLGGIFLGPSVLGRQESYLSAMFSAPEQILVDVTSNLGLIYFLFLTMVKMDSPLTLRIPKTTWIIGISSILLPGFVNFFMIGNIKMVRHVLQEIAPAMAFNFLLTHFPSLVHVLEELNLLSYEVGQLALTSAAVNEIFAWSLVPIGLLAQTGGIGQASCILLSAIILVNLFYIVRPALVWVVSRTPEGRPVDEVYIVWILVGAIFAAFVTNALGLILLGSIIFGLAIPNGPPLATTLLDKSEVFIMNFLMPLFYIYVGFHTDIYLIRDWTSAFKVLLVTIIISLFKFLGAFIPAAIIHYKFQIRHAAMIGLLLNSRGAIELMHLRRWNERKVISSESYTIMVLANMMVTGITFPLIEILHKHQERSVSILSMKNSTAIHKSLQGSELRVITCVHGEEDVHSTITLLEASNPKPGSPICAYVVHLVELVGRTAPVVVPYGKHKKLLRSQSADHIMRAFDNYSRSSDGNVIVRPFTIIAPYKTMHQNIGKLAQDHTAHLIIMPFRKRQKEDVREVTFLHSLNSSIQASAPCTVGILVDNSIARRTWYDDFSYNVAVIFLGGLDDREALAFATRISGREGIQMTVIRILVNCLSPKDDFRGQKKLDDSVLEDFWIKNTNNGSAVYREVVVEDGVQVVNRIRSLELDYDLMILGRRPLNKLLFTEEMLSFTENPELGVIGDMLASEDLCESRTSLLVMQHFLYS